MCVDRFLEICSYYESANDSLSGKTANFEGKSLLHCFAPAVNKIPDANFLRVNSCTLK